MAINALSPKLVAETVATVKRLDTSQQRLLKQRREILAKERELELERLRLVKHITVEEPPLLKAGNSMVIIDHVEAIPNDYVTLHKQHLIDKAALKTALLKGKKIPGAHLAVKPHLLLCNDVDGGNDEQ